MMKSQLNFRTLPWHLIVIFLLLGIGIGTSGYFYYKNQKEHIRRYAEKELSAIADLKVNQIVNWRKERLGNATTVFRSPFVASGIHNWLKNPSDPTLRQGILNWMMSFRKTYDYESVILLDSKGNLRLSVSERKTLDCSHIQNQVAEALRTKKVILTDLHKSEPAGSIHLEIVIPILAPEGDRDRPISVLVLQVDPYQFLYPFIQSWPTPSHTAETLLIRCEGNEVVFLNELRHRKNTALSLRFPISEGKIPAVIAALGKAGVIEGVDYRKAPVLAALKAISDSPWFLVSKIDMEEVFAPYRAHFRLSAILTGLLIVGSGIILGFIWRQQQADFHLRQYETELERGRLEGRLDYLTRYANDIILLMDKDLKIVDANERAITSYGYTREELLQLYGMDLRTAENRPLFGKQMGQVEEYNGAIFETVHQRKDGTKFPVEVSSRIIEVEGEKLYQSIIRDITERKQAEEALLQSEERFRLAAESCTDLIYEWDIGTRIEWFGNVDELLGYAPGEFPRTFEAWANSVHPDDRDRVMAAVKNHLEKNEPYDIEYRVRGKDGTYNYWWVRSTAVRDEKGNPYRWVGAVTDITERKRAEEALRTSENKYKTLIESIPQKIFLKDKDSIYISCNKNYAQDLKIKPDEISGRTDYDFYSKALAEKYRADDRRIVGRGETEELEEKYIQNGQEVWVNTIKTPVKDEKSNIIGILGIFWDITEGKQTEREMAILEEQLRQSQKMEAIGRLAGGIAHDFNNLLTVVKGYSQLSLTEMKEENPFRENIEEIKKSADRAADLTRQLLAFSRRQIMEMKVLDLNDLLKNLDKMLRRVIGEDIELVTVLGEDLGRVKTDPGQIEQVIMNLVVNTRDAMPDGGKLTIETANVDLDDAYARNHVAVTPGRFVMISVSDTGVGMTPEVRDRVFEPFFTTKEKSKGTGLGLSTVYGIVKQSSGNIWVYSEPGKGTTFKIYLPRVDEPLEELGERVEVKGIPRGTETIFVVEDEEDVRKLTVRILERQGYKVLEASQGLDAFLIAEKYEDLIHLLVTDVVMPKISGRELADRIAEIRPEIKVLYMSGYTDNAIVHHGVLGEGMKFIQKPFTVDGLARKVREVLDKDSNPDL
jgi:PAS domain S-box-containing protein